MNFLTIRVLHRLLRNAFPNRPFPIRRLRFPPYTCRAVATAVSFSFPNLNRNGADLTPTRELYRESSLTFLLISQSTTSFGLTRSDTTRLFRVFSVQRGSTMVVRMIPNTIHKRLTFSPIIRNAKRHHRFLLTQLGTRQRPATQGFTKDDVGGNVYCPPGVEIRSVPLIPLVSSEVKYVEGRLLRIRRRRPTHATVLTMVPYRLLFSTLSLPIRSLAGPTYAIIVSRTKIMGQLRRFLTSSLISLSIYGVEDIGPAGLTTFTSHRVGMFLEPPPFYRGGPPLLHYIKGRVPLGILHALLPTCAITTFPTVFRRHIMARCFFRQARNNAADFLSNSTYYPTTLMSYFVTLLAYRGDVHSSCE